MPYLDGLPLAASVSSGDLFAVDQGGTPGVPGTATTRSATIAMIQALAAGVASFNTRSGPVSLLSSDVVAALTFTPYSAANPSGYQTAAEVAPYALYQAPYTGSQPQTIAGRLGSTPSVLDFGAKCDGSTDDTAAVVAAFATGLPVVFPSGICCCSDALVISAQSQKVTGAGQASYSPSGALISGTLIKVINSSGRSWLTVDVGTNWVDISGFTLTRTGTPISGDSGISFSGTNEYCHLSNVFIENQWVGVYLSSTIRSTMEDVISTNNLSYGVQISNLSTDEACQWVLRNVQSTNNGSSGFAAISVSGTAGMILGPWSDISTFANSGAGVFVQGLSGCPVFDLRISDSFIGSDASVGIDMIYTSMAKIDSTTIERIGLDPTGPNNGTAASNTGLGLSVDSNSSLVAITSCFINTCSWDGITNSGTEVSLTTCTVTNNGQAAASGKQTGVVNNSGGVLSVVSGNRIGNTSGTTQQIGVANAGTIRVYVGNDDGLNTATNYNGTAATVSLGNTS